MITRTLLSLVALAALPACTTAQPATEEITPIASAGAVTAADPLAQEAGMEMLRRGGSATDAAIAVMLALTVVEPQSSGIGGGGFYVRASADGSVQTLDGRETAPRGATPEWFLQEDGTPLSRSESVLSGLSVGVPGNIALAAKAHEQHGKLEWAELFEPAIALARGGYKINNRLFGFLERMPERVGKSASGKALFYDSEGEPLAAGTLVRNEQLAQTLELIASQGPSAFYNGALAGEIAQTVADDTPREGAMTTYDIGSYTSFERPPVCGSYRGYKVCGMGPPSSGGVAVMQMLGQLERFDLAELGAENPVTWHLFLESQRLAYADRGLYLADSDFVTVPVAGLVAPDYLAQRSELISADARASEVKAGTPTGAPQARALGDELPERGTSHFSVAGPDGTLISYTSTIEGPFGSGLMAGGFYLNNELTDFSRSPERDGKLVANRVEGGKRPRSSMAPTVVFDPSGKPVLAIGAAGGGTIPVQTARGIIGVIDFGLSAEEAIALPFIMGFGDRVLIEKGTWMEEAQEAFKALGHEELIVREAPLKAGAILRTEDGWDAARDPRIATGLIVP
ncbi:gamma-glutamyltransferase [Qipengyuania sp. DGS5-3]|uniref:gamma-glutamyltransferase n=1 Tax=Qipengyuania sp. DGS5-3 TaxID=3349632 RepID=UPI0036D21979